MRKNGSSNYYSEMRDREIFETYEMLISKHTSKSRTEIMEMLANSPTKRFWVSEFRASIVISMMMKGESIDGMNEMRKKMYNDMYIIAKGIKENNPRVNNMELATLVCATKAPCFYIKPASASVIISRIYKKRRCRSKK